MKAYVWDFNKIIADHYLTPEQVYNTDETGMFCCLSSYSVVGGKKSNVPSFKVIEDRSTVLIFLAYSLSGRLPSMNFYKESK